MHAREFTAGQKNCEKSGEDHRVSGPSRAAGRWTRALFSALAGPSGRWAVAGCGPSRAVGHRGPWAAGLWAAGLLLAKP